MPPQVKPNLGIGSTGLTVPGAGVNLDSLLREMEAKKQEYRWRNPQSMTAKKLNREDQQRQQYAQGAQAIGQEQLTQNIEGLGGTTGVEPIARGYMMAKDAAAGVGQMLAGEAADALGLDPVSLTMHASQKTGINPWLLGAAGVGIFGAGKMKKLGKQIAEQKAGKVGAALGDLTGHPPHLDMPEGAVMHADPPVAAPSRPARPPSVRTKSMDDFGEAFGTPVTQDIRASIEARTEKVPGEKKKLRNVHPAGEPVPESLLTPTMTNRARLLAEPSTMDGPSFENWTPKQIEDFGAKHNLDWKAKEMVPIEDVDPRTGIKHTWWVPGGMGKDVDWNYVNLHQLKHAGIDPNKISQKFHDELHHKMTASLQPKTLTDEHVFQGLMFGLASPNVPLHDTQMILTRVRPKSKADWDKLESYTKGKNLTSEERAAAMQQMMHDYGLTAGYKGGSGNASTNDLTRISELATVFRANPGMFRQQPGETIKQLAERMANIVPGLQMKTADMGSVWQDILKANSAPMDRHMADLYMPVLERSKLGQKWKQDALIAYNKEAAKEGWAELREYKQLKKVNDGGWLGDRLRDVINDTDPVQKYIKPVTVKGQKPGKAKLNKQVPKHLRGLPGNKVAIRGDYYEGALKQNEKAAIKSAMSLYQKQWQFWDAKRGQINPHEVMHPDLNKVPKMAWKDMHEANKELRRRGFLDNTGKATTPGPWEKAFYYGVPGAAAGLLGQRQEDRRE